VISIQSVKEQAAKAKLSKKPVAARESNSPVQQEGTGSNKQLSDGA